MIPMWRGLTALIVISRMSIRRTDQPGWGVSYPLSLRSWESRFSRLPSVQQWCPGAVSGFPYLHKETEAEAWRWSPLESGPDWNELTGYLDAYSAVSPLTTLSKHRISWPQCFFTVWASKFWKLINFFLIFIWKNFPIWIQIWKMPP